MVIESCNVIVHSRLTPQQFNNELHHFQKLHRHLNMKGIVILPECKRTIEKYFSCFKLKGTVIHKIKSKENETGQA